MADTTTAPTPTVTATTYTVSVLPLDHPDAYVFAIQVEYRGAGRWAVTRGRNCLDVDGRWDYEPLPSSREDTWLDRHRFDLDTALELAKQAAPDVTINRRRAADLAAEGRDDG